METELLPIPRHHLSFDLLPVKRIETVPCQGIHGFADLVLDELLVLYRRVERLFLKGVFPSSG